MNVEDILRIPPNKISTTKIMGEGELFKNIGVERQVAIKFIAAQKLLRNEYGIPYPTPDEMVKFFKTEQKRKQEVDNLVFEARVENLHDNSDRINDLHNYNEAIKIENKFPSAPIGSTQRRKEGGKKRSRKQRKQRRKKTRRSV
jgi:hypothetical protein